MDNKETIIEAYASGAEKVQNEVLGRLLVPLMKLRGMKELEEFQKWLTGISFDEYETDGTVRTDSEIQQWAKIYVVQHE